MAEAAKLNNNSLSLFNDYATNNTDEEQQFAFANNNDFPNRNKWIFARRRIRAGQQVDACRSIRCDYRACIIHVPLSAGLTALPGRPAAVAAYLFKQFISSDQEASLIFTLARATRPPPPNANQSLLAPSKSWLGRQLVTCCSIDGCARREPGDIEFVSAAPSRAEPDRKCENSIIIMQSFCSNSAIVTGNSF